MDRVHKELHGLGPQRWSMERGSMFFIRPYEYSNLGFHMTSPNFKNSRIVDFPEFLLS